MLRFADRGAAGAASIDQRSLMFYQAVLQKRALYGEHVSEHVKYSGIF